MNRQRVPKLMFGVLCILLSVGCESKAPTPAAEAPTSTPIPTPVLPLSVTVTKDLVYAKGLQSDAQVEWKLDLYAPAEPGDWPVVVLLHGRGQRKEGWTTLPQAIAEQGGIVFVVDYPVIAFTMAILDKGKGHRKMAETVACAVRFARARASDFGSDTAPMTIVGFSYGGGVGSHVALVGDPFIIRNSS